MKKKVLFIFVIVIMIAALFSACDEGLLTQLFNDKNDATMNESSHDVTDTDAHQHAYGEWEVILEATCTTAGEQQRVCDCGEIETQTIETLPHSEQLDPAVMPTCTQTGLTAGSHCAVCNEILIEQTVVDMVEHTVVIDAAVAATCTQSGLTEGKHCSECNAVLLAQEEIINPLGHNRVTDPAVAPTCTQIGWTQGERCSTCNEVFVMQELLLALGHQEVVAPAVAPTCTDIGWTEGKYCGECGVYLTAQFEIAATGHSMGEWYEVIAPTESQEGENRRDCVNCEYYETTSVAVLTHRHDRWEMIVLEAVAPTCTKSGLTEGQKCSGCGEVIVAQEKVAALGHTYESVVTEPTCTQSGYTTHTCHCGRQYTDTYVAAKGHLDADTNHICDVCFAAQIGEHKDADKDHSCDYGCSEPLGEHCAQENSHQCAYCKAVVEECADLDLDHYCDVCWKHMGEHADSPDDSDHFCDYGCGWELEGHSYSEDVTAPTCTEKGYTVYTCTVCGECYTGSYVNALGHTEVIDAAVAHTCFDTGLTQGKHCSVCHVVLVEQMIVPAAHTWREEYECNADGHWPRCSICEQTGEVSAHDIGTDGYCSLCNLPLRATEGIMYAISDDGTYASVTGYKGNENRIVIAEQYQGVPVKAIAPSAFQGSFIDLVHLPDSITEIGDNAFYECKSLEAINLPIGLTRIGDYAFYNCYCLLEIVIPDGITEISKGAFLGCLSLVRVTLPKTVTRIGNSAFSHCFSLTAIEIPDGVTEIGSSAFSLCHELVSVTIPDSVTIIGQCAFQHSGKLANLSIPDSVVYIGRWAFDNCNASIQKEDGVSYIDNFVLDVDDNVETVVLRNGTRRILSHAFDSCTSLTSVAIPEGVIAIDAEAFYGCNSLTQIVVPSSMTSIGSSAFAECRGLTEIIIPDSVTRIDMYAFWKCVNLESITIPDSVISIGKDAFGGCESLTELVIPDSVTYIGEDALRGCDSLVSITLPFVGEAASDTQNTDLQYIFVSIPRSLKTIVITGGTRIESNAFDGCTYVKNIVIPDSVTYIGLYAFRECENLESITLPFIGEAREGTLNTHFEYIFGRNDKNSYGATPRSLKTIIITGGTRVDDYAFRGCSYVTSIILPDSITSIGEYAFHLCYALANFEIPDNVNSIGYGAFAECVSLTEVVIPYGVEKIDAFSYCIGLTSITIPSSVTEIGSSAFTGCTGLTSLTIPNSVTYIGAYAFYGCSNLKEIVVPDSVTRIGNNAFEGCTGLVSITLPFIGGYPNGPRYPDGTSFSNFGYIFGTLYYKYNSQYVPQSLETVIITGGTYIESYAFRDCANLKEIIILGGVEDIEYYAFYGCTGLTSITLPDSLNSISGNAFYLCNSIESIVISEENTNYHSINNCLIETATNTLVIGCQTSVIPDSVTSIGSHAFSQCTGLTSIYIPDSVTTIGNYAFTGCTGLTNIVIPNSVTSIGAYAFQGCAGLTSIVIPNSVTSIEYGAFEFCDALTDIYYTGSLEEWEKINISSHNSYDALFSATVHYNFEV